MKLLVALVLCFTPPLLAQQALFVGEGPTKLLVRMARNGMPFVEKDGKLVAAYSHMYALQKVPEYAPVFVDVRDIRVGDAYQGRNGTRINYTLRFRATFESAYRLDNVVMALELRSKDGTKALFVWEIPDMRPHEPVSIDPDVPIAQGTMLGKYQMHLFANGQEVLHSQMPVAYRERILNRMVAARIKGVSNAETIPFVGPAPQYPASLASAKVSGTATVSMHIASNGSVLDPRIESASDPAFGAPVLEAIRSWRFLPRIRDGLPVETSVSMPFTFAPQGSR